VIESGAADRVISFGPFRLLPAQRLLLEAGKAMRLGSRALDILIALVERPGELVSKEELMARVWPNTFVEPANLSVHVVALRRAIGDGHGGNRYLVTIPGRGYRFVAPVSFAVMPTPASPQPATKGAHNLPARVTRLVGRAETVRALAARLSKDRFLTIVGPGGIGKTSVALAVADLLIDDYEDGVWLIDLARLNEPGFVPSAAASALELEVRSEHPLTALIVSLQDKQMLLVLDNCEHVVEAAAAFAFEILRGASRVRILATSREPLRAEGEHIHRLPALGVPSSTARLSTAEALRYSAVELFVERATARQDNFELNDANASTVADICRKLDGIALAIEFAAGRIDTLGVRGLAARLDNSLRLLTVGARTAVPHHQTLLATLDWSYEWLPESERIVLRRLSIFVGDFTLAAATAVVACPRLAAPNFADDLANLVLKSLVGANIGGPEPLYRLLETTRAYALEKLTQSCEFAQVARRHAECYRDLCEKAETQWETLSTTDWIAAYGREIDNVRAALDWAFSKSGDEAIGVELTVASIPLWFQLSLMEECRSRVERALSHKDRSSRDSRRDMKLYAALGSSLVYTKGPVPENAAAWTAVLEIAERLEDSEYQMRALWGLWAYHLIGAEFRTALDMAERFSDIAEARADPASLLIGDRITGYALHFLGDLTRARSHIERMLSRSYVPAHRSQAIYFLIDPRATGQAHLARILWLQGFPEQAMETSRVSVEYAESIGHAASLCYVLADAGCPISLDAGDWPAAERSIAKLLEESAKHGLGPWNAWGRCYKGTLLMRRGDPNAGLSLLRAAVGDLRITNYALRYTAFLGVFAECFGAVGKCAEGLTIIDEALKRCESGGERWCIAELLRIKGDLVLLENTAEASIVAEELFLKALEWARFQGALSWELRITISFARLLRKSNRNQEAKGLLASVYGRFAEGLVTADLQKAKLLIDELV
jgi:predicted ATPase/DNA-binding winged helix-turn-helix (wHTH) protein